MMKISTSQNKLLDKLTIPQLIVLRGILVDRLLENGYTGKYLEDFDSDLAERIIDEEKDKYLRTIFIPCQYKNKKGEVCEVMDCQKHIMGNNGVLVGKKSKLKIPKVKFDIEEETDTD